MKKGFFSLLSRVKGWGISYDEVPRKASQTRALEIYRKTEDDLVVWLVG